MTNTKARHFLSETQLELAAVRFRALGEPMRLRILQVICEKSRPVGEIVEAVGAGQANVSKHLSILTSAGILTRQKKRQHVYYALKDSFVIQLCKIVRKHLAG